MNIGKTYSSWTRNRLTPELRDRIRDAGEGRVDFYGAVGHPHSWSGCQITRGEQSGWSVGPNPEAAFEGALAMLDQPIVSLLGDAS